MNATTLLQRQHRNLQQLCEAVERGSASMRESLLPQLASDLAAHITVEEQLFYPWVSRALRDDKHLRVARPRHARALEALERAVAACVDSFETSAFTDAIVDLRQALEAHAKDQEASLFPQLERSLSPSAMRELAQAMMQLYDVEVEIPYPSDRNPSWHPRHEAPAP